MAGVAVPGLLLGLTEAGLRLGGYGYETSFFLPRDVAGETYFVENPDFGRRFFPPRLVRAAPSLAMKAHKPSGTIRIFVFGESAALGDPRPRYGASRYLEVLLRERFPDQQFEVINTAMTAINSHVILPIARECAAHAGDVWIVYMGNNEMVGPFGVATVFGPQAPPRSFVRLSLALQRTRLGQLLVDAGRRLRGRAADPVSWQGMEMFLQNEVPPNDPRRERVHASFRANLEDIVRVGLDAGARVVLSTVAVNLKDCPPFSSVSSTNLPLEQRLKLESLVASAEKAQREGKLSEAKTRLEEALQLQPDSAALRFQLAQHRLQQGETAAARDEFERARDDDTLPFRADARINTLIGQTARLQAGGGVALCDAAGRLAAESPTGVPGQQFLYEHVHLNLDGNYRLARAWAEAVSPLLPGAATQAARGEWATQDACERQLGLTDWNRVSVINEVIGRLQSPPLSTQTNNAERLAAFQAWQAELRARIARTPLAEVRAVYDAALRLSPDDSVLHENYAEFLEATGDTATALAERRTVCRLRPHSYFAHYCLGTLLKEQRQLPEARQALERAAALHPGASDVRLELGATLAAQKEWAAAHRELALARQLDPTNPRVALFLGDVLARLNQPAAALASFREAIQLKPDFVEARYRLAEHLATQGQLADAVAAFEEVLRRDPNHVKAHLNLGVALARLGRLPEAVRQFDETLRLDPQNAPALQFKRQAEAAPLRNAVR
jgi:tetratricopeptide (TPR) repeat protein